MAEWGATGRSLGLVVEIPIELRNAQIPVMGDNGINTPGEQHPMFMTLESEGRDCNIIGRLSFKKLKHLATVEVLTASKVELFARPVCPRLHTHPQNNICICLHIFETTGDNPDFGRSSW